MSKKIMIGFGILVVLLLWLGVSIYPDWMWFKNLGFSPVFWTMLLSKVGFGLVVWLLLIVIICFNLYIVKRANLGLVQGTEGGGGEAGYFSQLGISGKVLNYLIVGFILVASFIIASKGADQWDTFLRYLYQEPFGNPDPIFGKDIGFYVFSLPFYIVVRNGLLVFFFFAGLIAIAWYLKDGALQILEEFTRAEGKPLSLPKIAITPKAKRHLVFLGGIIALLLAWGYHLKVYGIMYSTQGPAFGASYTDVHVKIAVYRVLILLSLALAFILFLNGLRFRKKLIWVSAGIWVGCVFILGTALPVVVQKLVVKPNELAKESPYIDNNIDFTRKAYGVHKIKEVDFEVDNQLSMDVIKRKNATIQNIRIWDERPLLQTYRQIQCIRLYYNFNNVDVDRYTINNEYRQVMLAARELVVNQLPQQAKTWVNRHLTYTHGYGLALSPVNEVTSEGLPRLWVKDLPPSFEADLKVERPEIYYGEKTDDYVLVKTKTKEFDYPKGDKNVYSIYGGSGGVPIKSFLRRLLFAIEFMDPQILFTTYLSPESRIMYNRRIDIRTRVIAPFLDYDRDPYLVVSEGKLYWIQDAYTTSDMYPYSRPSYGHFGNRGLNYIRNSVKVTIDAYNGNVIFYVVDEDDPIVKTYSRIFPDLFKPFDKMPEDLKRHIRYPKDFFEIQSAIYTTYHMEDPQVFYNQEDLWQIPDEIYGDSRQEMEPYYVIIELGEEEKGEFRLMLPFTPSKKDNMIGWLAATSDFPNYGNLLVYKLPKEKLVYGPMQIEARVDQQTDISRELSLWDQRGSRVIRGNLLAIPIGESFIYVEPVYLEAKQEEKVSPQTQLAQPKRVGEKRKRSLFAAKPDQSRAAALPELKRVIVALGNRLVMEEDLDRALTSVLGEHISPAAKTSPAAPKTMNIFALGGQALEHYNKAKEQLRLGNWTEYGKELENLERVLEQMAGMSKEKQ